jgi:hypothetical protein
MKERLGGISKEEHSLLKAKYGDTPNIRHLENPRHAISVVTEKPNWIPGAGTILDVMEYARNHQSSEYVNWMGDAATGRAQGQKNMGDMTYVISTISSEKKVSAGYAECTGAVLTAESFDGKPISLLTHQAPGTILDEVHTHIFEMQMRKTIQEFIRRAKPKTIDAIIFGGKITPTKGVHTTTHKQDYERSIVLIGRILTEELQFAPRVGLGASTTGVLNVAVETNSEGNSVYLMADPNPLAQIPTDHARSVSFQWFNLEELKKGWDIREEEHSEEKPDLKSA